MHVECHLLPTLKTCPTWFSPAKSRHLVLPRQDPPHDRVIRVSCPVVNSPIHQAGETPFSSFSLSQRLFCRLLRSRTPSATTQNCFLLAEAIQTPWAPMTYYSVWPHWFFPPMTSLFSPSFTLDHIPSNPFFFLPSTNPCLA